MDCFAELARRHDINSGVILSGVGMLRDAKIGFYRGEKRAYDEHVLEQPHELLSYQGNLATFAESGKPVAHVHVQLGGPDHRVVGGHLFDATVWIVNEVAIRRLPGHTYTRSKNLETNLYDLSLGPMPTSE